MHAVVIRSTLHDAEQGLNFLRQEVIPRVRQAPGLVGAQWVRLGGTGTAMMTFESEEAAQAMVEQVRTNPPPASAVSLDSIEIGEVVERI